MSTSKPTDALAVAAEIVEASLRTIDASIIVDALLRAELIVNLFTVGADGPAKDLADNTLASLDKARSALRKLEPIADKLIVREPLSVARRVDLIEGSRPRNQAEREFIAAHRADMADADQEGE